MKRFLSIIALIVCTGVLAPMLSGGTGLNLAVSALLCAVALMLVAAIPRNINAGVQLNDVNVEIWTPRLIKQLFKDNEFLMRSEDDSSYVNYLTVHKPTEGAGQDWTENRNHAANTGGVAVNMRTDTINSYNISEWTSEPMKVVNAEKVQLSYNKLDSIINQMISIGKETIANKALYNWAATAGSSANILRTTGIIGNDPVSAGTSSEYNLANTTATGSRLVGGLYDLRRMKKLFDQQNIPKQGRCALYSANMYDDLISDIVTTKYRDNSEMLDGKNGVVNRVMGFDIYMRNTTVIYDNTGTPVRKAPAAAAAADDNDATMFWHPDFVCRAMGDTAMFFNPNQAVYYGDIVSALIRFGGMKNRATEIGVASLVQAAGA